MSTKTEIMAMDKPASASERHVKGGKAMDQSGNAAHAQPNSRRTASRNVGSFLWHLLQMVLAMEAGMMVYHHLFRPVLAPTGFGALTEQYPLFGYWMMVVSMALGMMALMAYHRSTWRHCLEMTTAMIAPLAALTVLVLCSLLPSHVLYGIGDPLMILVMAAYMLYHPGEHAHGRHNHAVTEYVVHG